MWVSRSGVVGVSANCYTLTLLKVRVEYHLAPVMTRHTVKVTVEYHLAPVMTRHTVKVRVEYHLAPVMTRHTVKVRVEYHLAPVTARSRLRWRHFAFLLAFFQSFTGKNHFTGVNLTLRTIPTDRHREIHPQTDTDIHRHIQTTAVQNILLAIYSNRIVRWIMYSHLAEYSGLCGLTVERSLTILKVAGLNLGRSASR